MQLWRVFLQHDDTGRNSECVVEAEDYEHAARNAQRRRGPRLDTGQHGIGQRKAPDLAVKSRDRLAYRGDGEIGQRGCQVGQMHAGLVRRNHGAELRGGAPGEKIANQLPGRLVGASAQVERVRFKLALESNAG